MSGFYTQDTDALEIIFQSVSAGVSIGSQSIYTNNPHPGTGKTIDGFHWNQRTWPTTLELEAESFAPSIFDGNTNFISQTDYRSGIGSGNDGILLSVEEQLIKNQDYWVPQVQHGYFYIYDTEYYTYSDDVRIHPINLTQIQSGMQFAILEYQPKPTIPIQVRRYEYNSNTGAYIPFLDFRKVIDFTPIFVSGVATNEIDTSKPEFTFNPDTRTILLNSNYATTIGGGPINYINSGLTNQNSILGLEQLGISDGSTHAYNTLYSPIDASGVFQLWVYNSPESGVLWDQLSTYQSYISSGIQYKVDNELGLVLFDPDGVGLIPPAGSHIATTYTAGLSSYYEPEFTRNYINAYRANTNPLSNPTNQGFVVIAANNPLPGSISIDTDLPGSLPNFIINLGNNQGAVTATVLDLDGNPLEGQVVTFDILPPTFGSFGVAGTTTDVITQSNGQATVYYTPPNTIDSFGYATTDVALSGGNTLIHVQGINFENVNIDRVYLYSIQSYDEVLGIPNTFLTTYYNNYLATEKINTSVTDTATYEASLRTAESMLSPTTYDIGQSNQLYIGSKLAVLTTTSGVVDPNTGLDSLTAFTPITPIKAINTGTSSSPATGFLYSGVLPFPGGSGIKAYFVVSNDIVQIQATTNNPANGRTLFSNIISINIVVPPEANGTYFANTLSALPIGLLENTININSLSDATISGRYYSTLNTTYQSEALPGESFIDWFRTTRRADSELLTLSGTDINGTFPMTIPLGFRLQSAGITIASLLDQVTYFDPNNTELPANYYSGLT
jgi:hypothetical protein